MHVGEEASSVAFLPPPRPNFPRWQTASAGARDRRMRCRTGRRAAPASQRFSTAAKDRFALTLSFPLLGGPSYGINQSNDKSIRFTRPLTSSLVSFPKSIHLVDGRGERSSGDRADARRGAQPRHHFVAPRETLEAAVDRRVKDASHPPRQGHNGNLLSMGGALPGGMAGLHLCGARPRAPLRGFGHHVGGGQPLEPCARAGVCHAQWIALGAEYYAALGPIDLLLPVSGRPPGGSAPSTSSPATST